MTVEQLSTSKISSTCPTGVNYISKYAGDLREKSHEVWTRNSNRSRCTAKKTTGGGLNQPPPPMGLGLKGKFPQTTMWIGWIESNFTNPTVTVWADLDNPFKRSDYAKLCMSPSLEGTLPEYVISQENNSPLTLYIDFQKFNFSWISIVLLIKFIHKCMHIHLSPNIPKYKRRGKIHFQER